MLHHRISHLETSSYDSITADEETSLVGPREIREDSSPRSEGYLAVHKGLVASSLLFLFFSVSVIVLTPRGYDGGFSKPLFAPSMLLSSWRKYEAQRMADSQGGLFLLGLESLGDGKYDEVPFEAPSGCEATVVIIRHCEKGRIREHCSYLGYERAMYLASLFGDHKERWPTPSYIFALAARGRKNPDKRNFREIETVQPLADKAKIDVDETYHEGSVNALTANIFGLLRSGEMCGKVALISWKHSGIPRLAHKLACGPLEGCPEDYSGRTFDEAWHIKFVYQIPDHSERKDGLLPNHNLWEVYGTVQQENFDPLSFSKRSGDYPRGGTSHGARWRRPESEVPERTSLEGQISD